MVKWDNIKTCNFAPETEKRSMQKNMAFNKK